MKTFSKHLRYPLWLAAIVLAFWWLMFGYKYQFIYNHGPSMETTHSDGDWIIIEKKAHLGKDWTPEKFDCIVIRDKNSKDYLVKRVIGLPGDKIEINKGRIFLNGEELKDPFGKGKILYYLTDENGKDLHYWGTEDKVIKYIDTKVTVPKDHIWIIGDNREVSWYGVLPIKDIKGLVIF